ncbi:hypothetical protein FRC17_011190 [Serendipita sp. 399]|nr:hypothetical protein FRC17_011190 [Serendipita sp. 399]
MSVPFTPQSCALVIRNSKQNALVPTNSSTIDRAAASLGSTADKLARHLGWGLQNATQGILDNLTILSQDHHGKEDREEETAQTQLGAFRKIVTFTTNYPGLRRFFLSFKGLDQAEDTKVAVERMWARKLAKDNPHRREWKFLYRFATDCVLGVIVAPVVEKCPINEMGILWKEGGCGILNDVFLEWNSCEFHEIPGLVAMRYIGGILQLPAFWQQANYSHHQEFTQKLFRRIKKYLEDIGFGREGPLGSTEHVSDIEGVDIVAHAVLQGVNRWSHHSSEDVNTGCWFVEFRKVVELLLTSEARRFLRNSSKLAIMLFADVNPEYPSTSPLGGAIHGAFGDNGMSSYDPHLATSDVFTQENSLPETQPQPWPQSIDFPNNVTEEYPKIRPLNGDSIEERVPVTPGGLLKKSKAALAYTKRDPISAKEFQGDVSRVEKSPKQSKKPEQQSRRLRSSLANAPLSHGVAAAGIPPVPFLKGIVFLSSEVVESIEAMDRTEKSLVVLARNARKFCVIIEQQKYIRDLSEDVRHALQDSVEELKEAQAILKRTSSHGRMHRYILQQSDEHVLSSCNQRIHDAYNLFMMRCVIAIHQDIQEWKASQQSTIQPQRKLSSASI